MLARTLQLFGSLGEIRTCFDLAGNLFVILATMGFAAAFWRLVKSV